MGMPKDTSRFVIAVSVVSDPDTETPARCNHSANPQRPIPPIPTQKTCLAEIGVGDTGTSFLSAYPTDAWVDEQAFDDTLCRIGRSGLLRALRHFFKLCFR